MEGEEEYWKIHTVSRLNIQFSTTLFDTNIFWDLGTDRYILK